MLIEGEFSVTTYNVYISTNYEAWLKKNKRHRVFGPAEIFGDMKIYWFEGIRLSKEDHKSVIEGALLIRFGLVW